MTGISAWRDVKPMYNLFTKCVRLCCSSCKIETDLGGERNASMRSSSLARKTTERKQKWKSQEGGFIEDLGHKLPRGIALCASVCVCAPACTYLCVCVKASECICYNVLFFILVRCHVRLSTRTYLLLQTN